MGSNEESMEVVNENVTDLGESNPRGSSQNTSFLHSPTATKRKDIFADLIIEETRHPGRCARDGAASLGLHVVVIVALMIQPLFFLRGIDLNRFNRTFLVAPLPPPAELPRPRRWAERTTPRQVFVPTNLAVPSFSPKAIATLPVSGPPDEEAFAATPWGVTDGTGNVLGSILRDTPPIVAPVSEGPRRPILMGGKLKISRLVDGLSLVYPAVAKAMRIFGKVVLQAIIDEHGNVTQVKVVSGPPLLAAATINAVSREKFEPATLDGEPTPIALRVEVSFHLTGGDLRE
jgi:periplasmic protein TonB